MNYLKKANAVIVARNFNPSILGEAWLIRRGIMDEGSLVREQYIHVPNLVRLPTSAFTILGLPDRIEFTPHDLDEAAEELQKLIKDKLGGIVSLLPETPYRAVGINFHCEALTENREQFVVGLKEAFTKQGAPILGFFTEPDVRAGAYLSKDVLGFRLRLDIKPISSQAEDRTLEGLHAHFNFHRQIEEEAAVEVIHNALDQWDKARELSETIFKTTSSGWLIDA